MSNPTIILGKEVVLKTRAAGTSNLSIDGNLSVDGIISISGKNIYQPDYVLASGISGENVPTDTLKKYNNFSGFTPIGTNYTSGVDNVTVLSDGLYLIEYYTKFDANVTGYRSLGLYINDVLRSSTEMNALNTLVQNPMTNTYMYTLNANDEITLKGYQNSGITIQMQITTLKVLKLGESS